MSKTYLNIVDENDDIIGTATRAEIHAKGLLHREVQILYITPDGNLIFQKRSLAKDTNPGLLTSSVGGHLERGETYEAAAVREAREETGIHLEAADLTLLDKIRVHTTDSLTQTQNVCHRCVYGFVYHGDIDGLQVEKGESQGYMTMPLTDMFTLSDEMKKHFTLTLVNMDMYGPIYTKLLNLTNDDT